MKTRVYQRGVHSFYEDLSTFLCNTAALGIALDAVRGGALGGFASKPDHYFEFEGCKVAKTLTWRPHASLVLVSHDQWPDKIELSEDASIHVTGGPRIGSIKGIISTALGAAFVRYFESKKEDIRLRYGQVPHSWPSELNFARIIRNAFAHGGVIFFENPGAQSVEWMGIRYAPSDNGREIIFRDIGLLEPILLMEEIDAKTR